jgi:hypothetical protein
MSGRAITPRCRKNPARQAALDLGRNVLPRLSSVLQHLRARLSDRWPRVFQCAALRRSEHLGQRRAVRVAPLVPVPLVLRTIRHQSSHPCRTVGVGAMLGDQARRDIAPGAVAADLQDLDAGGDFAEGVGPRCGPTTSILPSNPRRICATLCKRNAVCTQLHVARPGTRQAPVDVSILSGSAAIGSCSA